MKRLIYLLSIFILISTGLFADTKAAQPKKITSVVNVYHWDSAKGIWYEERLIKAFIEIFDNNGRLIQKDLTDGKDSLLERTLFTYSGNTIQKKSVNSKNEVIRNAVVTIEGNTHKEIVRRIDNSILFQYVTSFDQHNCISTIEHLDPDGKLIFKKHFEYDTKGNVIAIQNKNPDGSVAVDITYAYSKFDNDGNWLSRKESYTYGDVRRRPHEQVHRTIE